MSWASRQRSLFTLGFILFCSLLVGIPVFYWYTHIPQTCDDGVQNNGETAVDKGGSCQILDERLLSPSAVLWTRAFPVRDGSYNAVTYIENPNESAGVLTAPYHIKLYDARNILVAERDGVTTIMPGTVTPVFEGGIDTGSRAVARAYLEFTAPLVWERLYDTTEDITVESKTVDDAATAPRLIALVKNTSVSDLRDVQFVAAIFDTAGNAFAASSTVVPFLKHGDEQEIVYTWPDAFQYVPGRIDILPIRKPVSKKP